MFLQFFVKMWCRLWFLIYWPKFHSDCSCILLEVCIIYWISHIHICYKRLGMVYLIIVWCVQKKIWSSLGRCIWCTGCILMLSFKNRGIKIIMNPYLGNVDMEYCNFSSTITVYHRPTRNSNGHLLSGVT